MCFLAQEDVNAGSRLGRSFGFYDMLSKLWRSTPEIAYGSTRTKCCNNLKSGALFLGVIHTRLSVVAFGKSLFGDSENSAVEMIDFRKVSHKP